MSAATTTGYEPVIGLEVHVQLDVRTKLFSAAPARFVPRRRTEATSIMVSQQPHIPQWAYR